MAKAKHGAAVQLALEAPGLLSALSRGVQAASLYAPDHPSIARAAREAATLARTMLAQRSTLSIGITPTTAIIDSKEVPGNNTYEPLTAMLHQLDVASIDLRRGVTPPDLARFCVLTYRVRREHLGATELAKALKTATKGRIACSPIGYGALRIASGVRIESKSPAKVGWNEIVGGLLGGAGADPHVVASIVEARFETHELTGENLCPLREELIRLLNEDSSAAEKRRSTLEKVQTFVEALSPATREALLRVDLPSPEASIRLLFELIDVLPTSEVIKALESVDTNSKHLSKDALRLFHKLANISEQAPDHRAKVAGMFQQWTESEQGGYSVTKDLEGSLEEIFRRYDQKNYNPEQYDDDIERLSRRGATDQSRRRLCDADDLPTRAFEIAVEVCQGVVDGECDGAFDTILAGATRLLALGRFELLDRARLAAEQNLQRPGHDLTKTAARALLAHFADPAFTRQLLDLCCRCQTMPTGAEGLLRAGGAGALGLVLARIRAELTPDIRSALERFVAESAARDIRAAIDQISRDASTTLDALEPLLLLACNRAGVDLIEPLLRHPNEGVRDRAFALVARLDTPWPKGTLRIALGDTSPRIQTTAITGAADELLRCKQDAPHAAELLDMLAEFVEGQLACGQPTGDQMSLALDTLTAHPEGVTRVARGLRARSRAIRPRAAETARRLAAALHAHTSHGEIQRAVLAYRISPARIAYRIYRLAHLLRRPAP